MTVKQASPLKKVLRKLRSPLDRNRSFARLAEFHSRPRSLQEVVDWALNFRGGGGLYRVKTLQKRSEIYGLAKMVQDIAPKTILEIGTERGGTLLIWSAIASERVISCDIQDMTIQQKLFGRFPPPSSQCQVDLLSGDSHSEGFFESVKTALGGADVDFLFIDGDHSEKGVESDFYMYRRLVRPGGLIAFHDIVENQPVESNQVFGFWKNIKDSYQFFELVDDEGQCGYGIGVIVNE